MDDLISTAEADALIGTSLPLPSTETVALADAMGRTLAAPIVADRALPPYSRAMMDGIAFAASSAAAGNSLPIAGLHAAGDPPPAPLAAGQAWEIMTGACIPADCDTVVPYEQLQWHHHAGQAPSVSLTESIRPHQFIHPAGSDAKAGDILVAADHRIGPAEVAIAASVGLTQLQVARRPRIALISSGDEAVPVDASPEPWQIRRSNGPMLDALLRHLGHAPVAHHHIPDEPETARRVLHEALEQADLLILCGGISKGKRDLIRPLLEEKIGPPAFHGVLQRPGKPLAFWSGPPLVFALPGNPVSVLATFTRYVLPTLVQLEGREPTSHLRPVPQGIKPLPHLTWFLATDASGTILPPLNSGDFVSIAGATGFLEIPPAPEFDSSQPIRYFPLTLS